MKKKQILESSEPECTKITFEIPTEFYERIKEHLAQRPGWYSNIDEFIVEALRNRIFC